jgi:carboxypeptidase Q
MYYSLIGMFVNLNHFMAPKLFPVILSILFSFSTIAQPGDSVIIRKIASEVMERAMAYDNLRVLCKNVGPRLSGSVRAEKAIAVTAGMLKAAGADTVYLQPCMVPHWVRGEKERGYIGLANGTKHNLRLCSIGNAVGTGTKGVGGKLIAVSSFAELEQLGEASIKGKIVFFNFKMNPAYITTFSAYAESGVARRSGPAQAARFGAVGVMVRSLASNADDFPHTGATEYNDSFPKIPAVAISTNDADWLSEALEKKTVVNAWFRTTSRMLADTPSFNVIGEIRGSELPGEIITVGGHLDSWDLAEGAHDDGAGCVQSIEVIRALRAAGATPRHTIRAVLFMNEENGGRGGKKYAEQARANHENHVFALESDAGGFTPRGFSLEMSSEKMEKIRQWKGLLSEYGLHEFSAGGSGADIEPLKELGIPLAGLRPDSQRYFDVHHAGTDVFESVSRRELHLGAFSMAALIYLVDRYGL